MNVITAQKTYKTAKNAAKVYGPKATITAAYTITEAGLEKNTCVVRALSAALALPYPDAHALCAAHGRKRNDGMYYYQWEPILVARGAVNELADGRKGWGARVVKTFVTRVATTGRWVIRVKGHAIAVVDGVVVSDRTTFAANKRVLAAWRVA